jgi:hypothetical protein
MSARRRAKRAAVTRAAQPPRSMQHETEVRAWLAAHPPTRAFDTLGAFHRAFTTAFPDLTFKVATTRRRYTHTSPRVPDLPSGSVVVRIEDEDARGVTLLVAPHEVQR